MLGQELNSTVNFKAAQKKKIIDGIVSFIVTKKIRHYLGQYID